mmetsp:Transcript_21588/g.37298  ORF Transcript_21588/g.37298 Transcript_21588/m.37298 type:complete len:192 (-) Transcript_21588:61-636(-)|eukprot:CAMPEP_0184971978 /NCGR_PEP_ID=MMETSP1098-20130426/4070_1 /TAXON_ID=89044 /ORGANISM="Spumella elongata, Strain CCAP 955/1" /LENGTH=191 /DNA_ID=CAMNT_0027494185 /DNA_START=85 /DNA_END=660 /DNA_ORIENTATION=-
MDQKEQGFDIEDEEVFFEHNNSSPEDEEFDTIVSALEEILQDDGFQALLNSFYQDNCDKFEESKENKLEYTVVFDSYTAVVEKALEDRLSAKISGFTMEKLERIVLSKKDELSGEIFDLLCSLGDFMEFKDTMVAHKNAKAPTSRSSSEKVRSNAGAGGLDLSIAGTKATAKPSSGKGGGGLDLSISGKKV